MTITLLCAGALARPGGQRTDIEPDPRGPRPAWLPAAQLRNEMRDASRVALPDEIDRGSFARTLRRGRVVAASRAEAAAPVELPDETWLRERFRLDGTTAACALPASGDAAIDVVVRPVHLHLGLDHLVLAPPGRLAIAEHEASELAAAANHWLAEQHLEIVATRPDAWRLRTAAGAANDDEMRALGALHAPSARNASGRNVDAWQPSGPGARTWRRLNNLIQMSWFEHPVNTLRESQGRLPVNALWLEGRAGEAAARPFDRVWTTERTIAGLGHRSGATTTLADLADRAADADFGATSDALIAPGFWQGAVEDGDDEAWREGWRTFELWFARCAAARSLRGALRVVLSGERSLVEVVREPADRWKPWRAVRLVSLLEDRT